MPTLFRDFETRSALSLKSCGAWNYARHPQTEVLCGAFAVDDGEVGLWLPGEPIPPEFVEAASNPDWIVSAFNAAFERAIEVHIMAPRFGWPLVPIERQRCSQAAALAHALPASLANVAAALGLAEQKDAAGQQLMLQMSRPRKPRKGEDPNGIYWFDDADRRLRLYNYCKQDVAVERAIARRIPPLSPDEQKLWQLDAEINGRGIPIDVGLLHAALAVAKTEQDRIDAELTTITQGALGSIHVTARLLDWLRQNGRPSLVDVRSSTLKTMLEDPGLPATTRRVIELRLAGAHASAGKLRSIRNWNDGGRLRGAFRFHGASTGRWTSLGVQLQNLKRPETKDLDAAIAAVSCGDMSAYARPIAVLGDLTRAIIAASPGHRFIAADLSGVESRITAWVSGAQSKVQQWAAYDASKDPQDEPYRRIGADLGLPPETARSIGKVCDLAFGYAGGVGAWRKLAPDDTRTDEQIKELQQRWRNAHPAIVRFWKQLDRAAVRAVQGKDGACGPVSFRMDGVFLKLRLPSGRELSYPFARLAQNDRGDPMVIFQDNQRGKFADCRNGLGAYGGLWTENLVQAIARDVFAHAMPKLEAAAYPIVMHVHDEIIAEVPIGAGSVDEFVTILTTTPTWAEGLPLAAKGRNGPRFAHSIKPAETPPIAPEPEPEPRANGHTNWQNFDFNDDTGDSISSGRKGRQTREHTYYEINGAVYGRKVICGTGAFWQVLRNGVWVTCGKKTGEKLPPYKIPYRLPELMRADRSAWLLVCEGEKDAENVAAIGLAATSSPDGAGQPGQQSKWPAGLNVYFHGFQRVAVLADNDAAGAKHARDTANALRGVVPDIRVIEFPELPEGGDVSDWLDQGHTKAELLDRIEKASPYKRKLEVHGVKGLLSERLPPRGWLLGNQFCRQFISMLFGDGGVGKSTLRLAQYIAAASGRSITGDHVFVRARVLIITLEDGLVELKRRIQACCKYHGITEAEIEDWLFYCAVGFADGKLAALDERGRPLVGDLARTIETLVADEKIDLVGIDPFVKAHGVGENDNNAIDLVCQVLSNMADEHDIGVDLSHHVRKGASEPGDADAGRGASAAKDAARLVHTLTPMSADDAKRFGIEDENRRRYVRLDKGKVNLLPPSRVARWFELVGQQLGNGTELYPAGDEIQAIRPWTPPKVGEGISAAVMNAILDDIDAGPGKGHRYTNATSGERQAWVVVQSHCPDRTDTQCRELIKKWVDDGVLTVKLYKLQGMYHSANGLEVDPAKRPKSG